MYFFWSNISCTSIYQISGSLEGISKTVPWTLWSPNLDENGQYVIVSTTFSHMNLTVQGVYAPNAQRREFGEQLYSMLRWTPVLIRT